MYGRIAGYFDALSIRNCVRKKRVKQVKRDFLKNRNPNDLMCTASNKNIDTIRVAKKYTPYCLRQYERVYRVKHRS